jgi:DNA-directed RNA polymerase subunit beta'
MAVHVPLSVEAQVEARVLMMSTNNILSPAHGKPIIIPTQDMVLGLYHLTRERPFAKGEGMRCSSRHEVRSAYDSEELDLQARIKVRIDGKLVETTTGRVLMSEVFPEEIPFEAINQVMNKKVLADLISLSYRLAGEKDTVVLADKLKDLGFRYATAAGISVCLDDLRVPQKKVDLLRHAQAEVQEIQNQYTEGLITDGERYNKVIDIWAQVTEQVANEMMKELGTEVFHGPGEKRERAPSLNPIFTMADSGARGTAQQVRQLAGMRGLMAKPSGEIIETPITANFREGLTVLQYFISTHGARKGLADTALKTANSGYLTRRLVDVAQDTVILEEDCGTIDGIYVTNLVEGGEIVEPVGDRILGRVALEDILDPFSGEVLVNANEEITEDLAQQIEEAGIEKVRIRSVLTCRATRGICAMCYGRDLARGKMVNVGEPVGVVAAQSIGEPGTQLTMRTFHIGGTASRSAERATLEAKNEGRTKFINIKTVLDQEKNLAVLNRNGEMAIVDEQGREKERYAVVYGARLKIKEGQKVKAGEALAEWDPYTTPIATEVGGRVKFGDIIENITMQEQVDEITGLARRVIIPSKDPDARPRISIKDESGRTGKIPGASLEARYLMPVGANIMVAEGDMVYAGDVLAKIPRETTKTKDITGGLPRVAELFEARKPKEHAVIAEIDGTVSFGKDTKGKRMVKVTPDAGEPKEYLTPKGKHVTVREGDRITAGEPIMEGSPNPHDILQVKGEKELARYLVDEVQEVYRLQGVKINDKHIEVIVRQMLKRVRIKEVGDTEFLVGEQVEKQVFEAVNEEIIAQGRQPAIGEPLLLGITKASLSTESFISAASFQETTRVLTEAAIGGKVDWLRGLKENVIMGRLIPAGTGFPSYRELDIDVEGREAEALLDTDLVSEVA